MFQGLFFGMGLEGVYSDFVLFLIARDGHTKQENVKPLGSCVQSLNIVYWILKIYL